MITSEEPTQQQQQRQQQQLLTFETPEKSDKPAVVKGEKLQRCWERLRACQKELNDFPFLQERAQSAIKGIADFKQKDLEKRQEMQRHVEYLERRITELVEKTRYLNESNNARKADALIAGDPDVRSKKKELASHRIPIIVHLWRWLTFLVSLLLVIVLFPITLSIFRSIALRF